MWQLWICTIYVIYVDECKTVNADYNAELFGKIKIYRALEVQVIYCQLYQGSRNVQLLSSLTPEMPQSS